MYKVAQCSVVSVSIFVFFSLLGYAKSISPSDQCRAVMQAAEQAVEVTALCKKVSTCKAQNHWFIVSDGKPANLPSPSQPDSPSTLPGSQETLGCCPQSGRGCGSVAEPLFLCCPGKEAPQTARVATRGLVLLSVSDVKVNQSSRTSFIPRVWSNHHAPQ